MSFDRYVAIDWSAAASPKTGADSIWIADVGDDGAVGVTNPSTRRAAAAALAEIVDDADQRRVLVGIDASLGYPRGTAAHFSLSDAPPWHAMWSAITSLTNDDEGNRNNRFDVAASLNGRSGSRSGPFWGCPSDDLAPILSRTKPPRFDVPEFRMVEERLRAGGRYPKSVWQLLGAGAVGSQSLTLIPVLHRLLGRVDVWPLTTGLGEPAGDRRVVVAEIWPSMFLTGVPAGMVRDAAQVTAAVEAMRAADESGDLARWFAPAVDDPTWIVREEGWIFGVG